MSFFDKFKRNREIDSEEEEEKGGKMEEKDEKEENEKKDEIKPSKKKVKKNNLEKDFFAKEIKIDEETEKKTAPTKIIENKKGWFEQEGQLAVDVFQTDNEIYVQSAIAGVSTQDIDITIENDMIIIKGNRAKPADLVPESQPKDYFYQECYWGPFSRQIILPAEVDNSRVEAVMKNGILTVKVPKIKKDSKKKVSVKGD